MIAHQDPQRRAQGILEWWICSRRESNASGRVELKDVSNWEEVRCKIRPNPPPVDSEDGALLLFCLGSLLSYGGGNYKSRVAEIRNRCDLLISREFKTNNFAGISGKRIDRYRSIDSIVSDMVRQYGSRDFLQSWWKAKKESFGGDLDLAGKKAVEEILGWKMSDGKPLFTIKAFWIPRELSANGVWPDFPVKYCCVPDRLVRKVLGESVYGPTAYMSLFGKSHKNASFKKEVAFLISENVAYLFNAARVDGFFPYDAPLFRLEYEKKREDRKKYRSGSN